MSIVCPNAACIGNCRHCAPVDSPVVVLPPLDLRKRPVKRHVCSVCHKAFNSKCNLIDHERIHTGEKPFECSTCQKTFRTKGGLAKHSRIHTGKRPFVCTTCHKTFTRKDYLGQHEAIMDHTDAWDHMCHYCNKKFRTGDQLFIHYSTHTGVIQ